MSEYAKFVDHYSFLHEVVERVFCRTLEKPSMEQSASLLAQNDHRHPDVIAFENRMMADLAIFFLGRIAADDFGEIVLLAGNGRGVGAYKILRGMYERVVTATYFDAHPAEARPFALDSDIQKLKFADRLNSIGVDVLGGLEPAAKEAVQKRADETNAMRKKGICPKCKQPISQTAWTKRSLDEMAKEDRNLHTLYGPCYLEPTYHHHATAFGLERRLRVEPSGGYTYNVSDYRNESRKSLMFAHNLLLANIALQGRCFRLQLDADLRVCGDAFKQIWGDRHHATAEE